MRKVVTGAVFGFAWLAAAAPLSALQARLITAKLSTSVAGHEDRASVQIRYAVRPAGEVRVPLAAVLFDGTRFEDVSVSVAGRSASLEPVTASAPDRMSGHIVLTAAEAALAEVAVDVRYTTIWRQPASERRVQIPVFAIMWPPADALPGTFLATVMTPEGWSASDPTPAVARAIKGSPGAGFETDLQVVPALISFRLVEGDATRFGAAALLDAGVVVLLIAFGWVGWKHFREQA